MQLDISLNLPRDAATLPLVRHVARNAMREWGVEDECTSDVELALTEACANVVHHSEADDDYRVTIQLCEQQCDIRVIDAGRGFDFRSLSADREPTSERGRGITLMQALVDAADFRSEPEVGSVVHLVKEMTYRPDAAPLPWLKGAV